MRRENLRCTRCGQIITSFVCPVCEIPGTEKVTSLAALTLEVAAVIDDHMATGPGKSDGDDFSMGIHGIDSSLSDNDPDVSGIARNIWDDIQFNHWSDSHGDWSYSDTLEFGDLLTLLEDALIKVGA